MPGLYEGMKGMTDGIYYFNRCRRCQTLLTKLQIARAFKTDGQICTCGGGMFGPTNPLWYEWLLPRVLRMVVYQLMGWLAPAPAPEVKPPAPLPFRTVPALAPEEIRPPEESL